MRIKDPLPRAVVLLSGGLDSTTLLHIALDMGFSVYALSFSYGQKHNRELELASGTASRLNIAEHRTVSLDRGLFSGSSLTDGGAVPDGRSPGTMKESIPDTYVPARNTVFLSMALAFAEQVGAGDVFIGVNAVDYSGYPDCRPEFIDAFQKVANLATRSAIDDGPVRIRAPLLDLSKAEIIKRGLDLGVDYSSTISCYRPDVEGRSCGSCDACILRLQGFRANRVTDPAPYVESS